MESKLELLTDNTVQISDSKVYPEEGQATVDIAFSNGTKLRASYWRLIKDGKQICSSFDHAQQYGLPAPINAKAELQNSLSGKKQQDAKLDNATGDLVFKFSNDTILQVLNFTGYEIWEIKFPDGTTEYSNHIYRL